MKKRGMMALLISPFLLPLSAYGNNPKMLVYHTFASTNTHVNKTVK
jgi:hypothetical protein